jgi:hypothetical protein
MHFALMHVIFLFSEASVTAQGVRTSRARGIDPVGVNERNESIGKRKKEWRPMIFSKGVEGGSTKGRLWRRSRKQRRFLLLIIVGNFLCDAKGGYDINFSIQRK